MRTNVARRRVALLTPDKALLGWLRAGASRNKSRIQLFLCGETNSEKTRIGALDKTFLVSRLTDFRKVDEHCFRAAADKRFVLFCSDINSIEDLPECLSHFRVHDPERIYVMFETPERSRIPILRRLVAALSRAEGQEGILDLRMEDDVLKVVSAPSLKRLRVPLHNLPSLRNRSLDDLRNFEIDEDGSFVYWPKLDVHLGWEQFLQASNPAEALKARQRSADFNRCYGRAIRKLRNEMRLSQAQVAGLTARQISRIEKGECRATSSALAKLAVAHQLSANEYMEKLARSVAQLQRRRPNDE